MTALYRSGLHAPWAYVSRSEPNDLSPLYVIVERGHPVLPRIDLLCMTVELGTVHTRAILGTPSGSPCRPCTPAGWLPVGEVFVPSCVQYVTEANIREVHP